MLLKTGSRSMGLRKGRRMNREIKFRAWSREGEEMLSWERLASSMGIGSIFMLWDDPQGYVLMQWIGLNDKFGSPIYEGDVLSLWPNGHVVFTEELAAFGVRTEDSGHLDLNPNIAFRSAVIGNIFEHPHLLKGQP